MSLLKPKNGDYESRIAVIGLLTIPVSLICGMLIGGLIGSMFGHTGVGIGTVIIFLILVGFGLAFRVDSIRIARYREEASRNLSEPTMCKYCGHPRDPHIGKTEYLWDERCVMDGCICLTFRTK